MGLLKSHEIQYIKKRGNKENEKFAIRIYERFYGTKTVILTTTSRPVWYAISPDEKTSNTYVYKF